jgi:hypothetical protein
VDTDPNADRSESSLAVNPLDSNNLVGSSKRFTNPSTYEFTLAAYASFDNGLSWTEAPPLQLLHHGDGGYTGPDWAGVSDPEVAFDDQGTAYLIALPFVAGANPVGIAIYQSADGGLTWSPPNLIHFTFGDDKPGAAADDSPLSPYFGNVYTAWDDGVRMRFARTTDRGATWTGVGGGAVGTVLATDSFAPALSVADDGTLYISWVAGSQVKFVKSSDGGDSFSAPAVLASGIRNLDSAGLHAPDGFPELPGGRFRVVTLAAIATGPGSEVVVAWADYRENVSRIYYRRSTDGGLTWEGPASGQPLLTGDGTPGGDQHDFHPQLARSPRGGGDRLYVLPIRAEARLRPERVPHRRGLRLVDRRRGVLPQPGRRDGPALGPGGGSPLLARQSEDHVYRRVLRPRRRRGRLFPLLDRYPHRDPGDVHGLRAGHSRLTSVEWWVVSGE